MPDPAAVDRTSLPLRVDLLGPLALRVRGTEVDVPGVRRRTLLALLALAAGRVVGADRLVDGLWPDAPPDNAVQALYSHVSRLRGHLGPLADRLERHGGGYLLRLEPGELDLDAARRLGTAIGDGRPPVEAAALGRAALELWRGPALEEFRAVPELEVEAVAVEELRLRLVDDLLAARLATGEHGVVVDSARATAAAPLRERTALLHVRALAAEGRTADAMAAAQEFRRRVVEEAGLDPSPALAELEQLVAAGALASPSAVPPTASTTPTAPARPARRVRAEGPLVGRRHERAEVTRLLATHGMVTLAGPGGVGKTRLSLDIAADPHEPGLPAVVVDLAAVDRPERVCQAVVTTLGLRLDGDATADDIAGALSDAHLLVVLDNCEHVSDAARRLVEALGRRAAGVAVLATSRASLNAAGEYVVRLQPLAVPRDATDPAALDRHDAVRAFVEHARRRRPDFDVATVDPDDLVEVLRRLDGLPLGIELAARQVAVMPLRDVRERLDRALDLATGRGDRDDERQRTLRATIDSSYCLLAPGEQALLRALAPFPGGADLATVEAVAADLGTAVDVADPVDTLHRLVDVSLLTADPVSGRYRLLYTVRAFLLDELTRLGELEAAEERFLDRCLAVAEDVGRRIMGPEEVAMDARLRAELDNFRAARDVARTRGRDDVPVGITLALEEGSIWRDLRELWAWALELADDPRLDGHGSEVEVVGAAGEAARLVGDLDRARTLAERALALAGPDATPAQLHRSLRVLGSVAHFRGDFARAAELWIRSGEGRSVVSGAWLASAALATAYGGDHERARELLDRAHPAIRRSGCGSHAAFAAYVEGELRATTSPAEAVGCYLEAIEMARRAGTTFVVGVASVALASARTRLGDLPAAARDFAELLDLWQRTGHATQLWTTARNAAGLLAEAGRHRTAALLLMVADVQPGAAAVGPSIARHSSRVYVSVDDLVPAQELTSVRAEADRLTAGEVLDRARAELLAVAG